MSADRPSRGGLAAWAPHLVCVAVALAMVAGWRALHTPTDEALRVAFDDQAATDARIRAMQLVANRARERDPRIGTELAAALLRADDFRLREAALLMDLCRHHEGPGLAPLQANYLTRALAEVGWTPHTFIARTIHQRKVGGPRRGRLDRREAEWFLDALRTGRIPPASLLNEHVLEREARARAFLGGRADLMDEDD